MVYWTALLQTVTGEWEDTDVSWEGDWVKRNREKQQTTAHRSIFPKQHMFLRFKILKYIDTLWFTNPTVILNQEPQGLLRTLGSV